MKKNLKEKAVKLRVEGKSYSEIQKHVQVSKSTLSLWLHEYGLSKTQRQRLTQKKREAALRGALERKRQRQLRVKEIKKHALEDLHSRLAHVGMNELWLMGLMLYWAEGSKEKAYRTGESVIFSNSDPRMIQVYLRWVENILCIPHTKLVCEIYVHEEQKEDIYRLQRYWASVSGFDIGKFDRIYYKPNTGRSLRKNQGADYYGQLRIRIRKSADLNRKIAAWIEGLHILCGVV